MDDPIVTITIVHYNKLEKLKNTIKYIEKKTEIPYEIKIYNNGHLNNKIDNYLSHLDENVEIEIIYGNTNIGCSPARKKLFDNIDTPFIASLDDDMYVDDAWFEKIKSIFNSNPQLGVIGIPFVHTDENVRIGGRNIKISRNVVRVSDINWTEIDDTKKYLHVDDVPAGSMVIRREVLDEMIWDDNYFIGFDDLDKGIQLMESEWDAVMTTDISFTHDQTTRSDYQKTRKDFNKFHQSYCHFIEKWGYRLPIKEHFIYYYLFQLPNWAVSYLNDIRKKSSHIYTNNS